MSDNDFITIPDRTTGHQYTAELAARLGGALLDLVDPSALEFVALLLSTALNQISRDIAAGRIVQLEHLGEFIKIDQYGPGIRYQASRRLLEACALANLKQFGVNQHGNT